jgi:hypothetical protein
MVACLTALPAQTGEDIVVTDQPTFWFGVKRYGYGWGLPVRWQGWAVLVAYLVLLYTGIGYFKPRRDGLSLLVYLAVLSVALVVIIVMKGERPLGWRWGKK